MVRSRIGLGETSVDPADEISLADVSDEQQGEAVGRTIQHTLPQLDGRQRTHRKMGWHGASWASLLVAAFGEVPIAREAIAAWRRRQLIENCVESRAPMLLTISRCDAVGDTLQRDEAHDPIEDRPGIVGTDVEIKTIKRHAGPKAIDEGRRRERKG